MLTIFVNFYGAYIEKKLYLKNEIKASTLQKWKYILDFCDSLCIYFTVGYNCNMLLLYNERSFTIKTGFGLYHVPQR